MSAVVERFRVDSSSRGDRLDRFLAAAAGISRSRAAARIVAGDVRVDGCPATKASHSLVGGERIELSIPPPRRSTAIPENIPIQVVFEDEHLCVVNKVAGMVVHPSHGHDSGTLVNALLHRYDRLAPADATVEGYPRPGIVHRLDRGTSGLLVVARTLDARVLLQEAIAARDVKRHYLAIIHGPKLPDEGSFDTLHGRHPRDRKRFSSKVSRGKRAITHYRVLARARSVALVACRLHTGRTHQIRVHFADAGHPLVGDTAYGGRRRAVGSEGAALKHLTRQALHAWRLEFAHPVGGEPLCCRATPPDDMAVPIRKLFGVDPETLD